MVDSFPRRSARTRRFSLGVPRAFRVSPDGRRIAFLRAPAGDDPSTCLWTLDVESGTETLLVDPRALLDGPGEDLPEAERARRERSRERAAGVVGYATDEGANRAVFALSGAAYLVELSGATPPRRLSTATPVIDPRLDPTGSRVAYVSSGALRIADVGEGTDVALAEPDGPEVTWGLAEFIASEEMDRDRGYWWSPTGDALLAARVDESPVQRWHIADPANPHLPSRTIAYPAAGTANADVSLWLIGLDGTRQQVRWDNEAFPYLVTVRWHARGALCVVQTRDQRTMRILAIDPATGSTSVVREDTDPVWLEIVPGVPDFTAAGELIWIADDADTSRLLVGDRPVTPPGLQVRGVLDTDGDTVLFVASTEPAQTHLLSYGPDGVRELTKLPGVHSGTTRGGTTVVTARSLDYDETSVRVLRESPAAGVEPVRIASHAEHPELATRVELFAAGARELRTALVLPSWHTAQSGALPVLLDPYGGPGAQQVVAARAAYWESQWLAEQGFAVLVADGRGTPARGPSWTRAIRGDMLTMAIEDQVDALRAAAQRYPGLLDVDRVGIRGWSFGGYLAAGAVLRRPDVFHAAVAGAPPTDWRLYDTHYTERYLGHPDEQPDAYRRSSLLHDAGGLTRPLLLIHGLADDNVLVAHTLRLSAALLAAGRPHTVLPLSGIAHMAAEEVVAENLLLLQVDFLAQSLGFTPARTAAQA